MATRKELEERFAQFERKMAPLKAKLRTKRRELKTERRQVNRSSQRALDAINKKVDEHNKLNREIAEQYDAFNAEQKALMSPKVRAQQDLDDAGQLFMATRNTPQQIAERFGLKVADVVKAINTHLAGTVLFSDIKVKKDSPGFKMKNLL